MKQLSGVQNRRQQWQPWKGEQTFPRIGKITMTISHSLVTKKGTPMDPP